MKKLFLRFLLSIVLLLFVGTSIHLSEIKPPSCDEIFSYYHSKGGDYQEFFEQTRSGFNRMPPLYFLFCKIFFSAENFILQARLFSLFTALLSILCLYKIARIWLGENLSFLLSVSLLTSASAFQEYAIDARPYSLCFFWSVLFVFRILRFEIHGQISKLDKFYLFGLCLLLPSSHYLYGITAVIIGMTHVYSTKFPKFEILKIYIFAGISFVVLHLAIFIEQQQFENLLMMIVFPGFEEVIQYILGFVSLPVATLLIIVWFIFYFISKKQRRLIKETSLLLIPLSISLVVIFLTGVLLARIFPESTWVLPRYYLGTLLVLPLFLIFLFSLLKQESKVLKTLLIILIFSVSSVLFLNSYKHKKYYYENERMHSYQRHIPAEIRNSELPIYTKDIILFFYYIYEGKNIHYLRDAPDLLSKIAKFVPNYSHCFLKETELSLPSVFINIGKGQPELDGEIEFSLLDCNVGPIHSAYNLQ